MKMCNVDRGKKGHMPRVGSGVLYRGAARNVMLLALLEGQKASKPCVQTPQDRGHAVEDIKYYPQDAFGTA